MERTTIKGTADDMMRAAKARAADIGRKVIQGRGHLGGIAPLGPWCAVVPLDATSAQDDRGEVFVCDPTGQDGDA